LVVHGAFAESMIARGPTLAADRETATGSLYVLGLPSVDAAREFVAREPNNRACVYADHFIWRFENLLGRTMWEFSGVADEPRFLVIARWIATTTPDGAAGGEPCAGAARAADCLRRAEHPRRWRACRCRAGVQVPDRDAVVALLEDERTGVDVFQGVDIHDWEFGGRR
jgi:uncharacterized protein